MFMPAKFFLPNNRIRFIRKNCFFLFFDIVLYESCLVFCIFKIRLFCIFKMRCFSRPWHIVYTMLYLHLLLNIVTFERRFILPIYTIRDIIFWKAGHLTLNHICDVKNQAKPRLELKRNPENQELEIQFEIYWTANNFMVCFWIFLNSHFSGKLLMVIWTVHGNCLLIWLVFFN